MAENILDLANDYYNPLHRVTWGVDYTDKDMIRRSIKDYLKNDPAFLSEIVCELRREKINKIMDNIKK